MRSISERASLVVLHLGIALFAKLSFAQEPTIKQDVDPARVVGHERCSKCHQSEVEGWKKSHHAQESFKLLSKPEAGQITKKLGIESAVKSKLCTTCHETQKANGTPLKAISCESCHSHSGPEGDGGWLDVHGNLGFGVENPNWSQRGKETPEHLAERLEKIHALGMRRPENLYALAKNCFECHNIGSEKLVNQGGHPEGKTGKAGIEFVAWSQGEVRHNFQRDPKKNAEVSTIWLEARGKSGRTVEGRKRLMYVLGQLADLEVSLRNRSLATQKGNFLAAVVKRIDASTKALADMKRARIKEVDDLVEQLDKQLKGLNSLNADDPQKYAGLADAVNQVGNALEKENGDSGRWQRMDRLVPKVVQGESP